MTDGDRMDDVIERALKEQVAATEKPNQRRHLTVATLAVAVAMVEVAEELRKLREAIESRA